MSMKLDDELRAAFGAASEFIQPAPGLADHARRTTRARRRRQLATAAACAVVLATAGGAYAAAGRHHASAPPHPASGARVLVRRRLPGIAGGRQWTVSVPGVEPECSGGRL